MSSSLIIKIKKKGQCAQEAPSLIELSTTPTRELLREVHFPQPNLNKGFEKSEYWPETEVDAEYGYYSPLSIDTLNEIINFYQIKIKSIKERIKDLEENINTFLKVSVSSQELLESLLEKIDSLKAEIRDLKGNEEDESYFDSLLYYQDFYNRFQVIKSIYDDNKFDNFELVIFAA